MPDGFGHRGGRACNGLPGEDGIEHRAAQAMLGQQRFGLEIAARRVVLVQGMHRDPLGRGAGRAGQLLAPGIVAGIAHAHPIQRAQHDRLARTQQHHAPGTERIDNLLDRLHQSIAQRAAQRRRNVGLEAGDPQRSSNSGVRTAAAGIDRTTSRTRTAAEHGSFSN